VHRVHGPITVRLAFALACVMGLFVVLEQFQEWQRLFEPLNLSLAQVTEHVLRHMDMPVARRGSVLMHPDGFSYRITYVCSGFRPAALIAATLLVVPTSLWLRLCGLILAVSGIEVLNLCRLVHLYCTGVADPQAFFIAHRVLWNIVAIIAVTGFVVAWLHMTDWSNRRAHRKLRTLHALQ